MEVSPEGDRLAAGVEDDAAKEALAGVGGERLESAEIALGHGDAGLDLDSDNMAGRVFQHEIDFLARLRPEMKALGAHSAPGGLLPDLRNDEAFEQMPEQARVFVQTVRPGDGG